MTGSYGVCRTEIGRPFCFRESLSRQGIIVVRGCGLRSVRFAPSPGVAATTVWAVMGPRVVGGLYVLSGQIASSVMARYSLRVRGSTSLGDGDGHPGSEIRRN